MCVERIFKRVTSDMMVTMSVFEIYQEKVRDLLAQSTGAHQLHLGPSGVRSFPEYEAVLWLITESWAYLGTDQQHAGAGPGGGGGRRGMGGGSQPAMLDRD
ncbi:Kinesin-like protein kif22, partial [Perkinsus olseni]